MDDGPFATPIVDFTPNAGDGALDEAAAAAFAPAPEAAADSDGDATEGDEGEKNGTGLVDPLARAAAAAAPASSDACCWFKDTFPVTPPTVICPANTGGARGGGGGRLTPSTSGDGEGDGAALDGGAGLNSVRLARAAAAAVDADAANGAAAERTPATAPAEGMPTPRPPNRALEDPFASESDSESAPPEPSPKNKLLADLSRARFRLAVGLNATFVVGGLTALVGPLDAGALADVNVKDGLIGSLTGKLAGGGGGPFLADLGDAMSPKAAAPMAPTAAPRAPAMTLLLGARELEPAPEADAPSPKNDTDGGAG
jgi:hypothetical protein